MRANLITSLVGARLAKGNDVQEKCRRKSANNSELILRHSRP
jgi:hypothetical protein